MTAAIKVGDRVAVMGDPDDPGTVIALLGAWAWVGWDDDDISDPPSSHHADRLISFVARPTVRTWTVTTEHREPKCGEAYVFDGGVLKMHEHANGYESDVIVKVEATS